MTKSLLEEKAVLRHWALEKRKSISATDKKDYDAKIMNNLFGFFDLSEYDCVLCYNSLPQEVDTDGIADELFKRGIKLYYPKTFSGGRMVFFECNANTELVEGFMGVLEPNGDTVKFDGENALCIVPGLCFSKSGQRLGYGAGFYDRFLEEKNVKKIALAYGCFIVDEVPCSPQDVRMDHIITQHGVIDCAEKSGGKR